MRSPLARISRARFIVCAAVCLAVLLAPARSFATHWMVNQSGAGDFTTIQAALDQQVVDVRDTILVMPGAYLETITLQSVGSSAILISVGGAAVTSINSLSLPSSPTPTLVVGFGFAGDVALSDYSAGSVQFERCAFHGTVFSIALDESFANFYDCDFYGRTRLERYVQYFRKLRFHSAPLVVTHANGAGSVFMEDCLFEGPADTLVFLPWSIPYDYISFTRCTFRNAGRSIVLGKDWRSTDWPISSCVFQDIAGAAIFLEDSTINAHDYEAKGLSARDSRFERCGTAVSWIAHHPREFGGRVTLERDTVLESSGDGVVLGPSFGQCRVSECVISGSGGHGCTLLQPIETSMDWWSAVVSASTFADNVGDGLRIESSGDPALLDQSQTLSPNQCAGNTFVNNEGAGLRLSSLRWDVWGCVAYSNGEEGIRCNTVYVPSGGYIPWTSRLFLNTSVLNDGDGFHLTGPASPGDSLQLIQHNLAAMNSGFGFQTPSYPTGSFAINDSWSNSLGQYDGPLSPADSNLTLDPLFCDIDAGVPGLGLQPASPCGSLAAYGLIGARTGTCGNTVDVPRAKPKLSFAVRPSVARGSVEFVPPSTGPDGRVEIFDITGRRHWGAAFGPTTGSLRWTGQSENGHAQPGLYWVRFTRAGETQSQRLVWLR